MMTMRYLVMGSPFNGTLRQPVVRADPSSGRVSTAAGLGSAGLEGCHGAEPTGNTADNTRVESGVNSEELQCICDHHGGHDCNNKDDNDSAHLRGPFKVEHCASAQAHTQAQCR